MNGDIDAHRQTQHGNSDAVCFLGAHLHVGIANDSGKVRLSIESRTICLDDIEAGHAAPNVDCHARRVMTRWFRHMNTRGPLCKATQP